jgi:hypothetical protein
MKKCSPYLTIKEIQIKTTLRFHRTSDLLEELTSRTPPPTNFGKDARKNEPSYTAGGNVSLVNHFGKQYRGFLKTKHKSAI